MMPASGNDGCKMYDDNFISKFWAKVEIRDQDDCWLWNGAAMKKDGRGIVWSPSTKKNELAPRVSLQIKLGRKIANGLFACHTCDNPACVNPGHLWEGSCRDNAIDASEKGRLNGQSKEYCSRGHKYEDGSYYTNRGRNRDCKECSRINQKQWISDNYERHKKYKREWARANRERKKGDN